MEEDDFDSSFAGTDVNGFDITNPNDLAADGISNISLAQEQSIFGGTTGTVTGSLTGANTSSTSTFGADVPAITAVSNGLATIGNSIANIFRANNGTAAQVNPLTGLPSLAGELTSGVTSFLPLIFIGLIIYLLLGIFRKHGR